MIEKKAFDKDLKLEWRTTYEFDNKNNTRTEKSFDSDSNIEFDDCGVAITVIKFSSSGYTEDWTQILEERNYDQHMKLVDCCTNNFSKNDEPYSIVQRSIINDEEIRIILLNSNNVIVSDEVEILDYNVHNIT